MKKAFNLVELLIFVAIILILSGLIVPSLTGFHHENKTIHVNSKGIFAKGKSSKYLLYCDDTTYEISDSYLYHRWDSSDWYGRVKEGSTYNVTVQGYRVPFLSWYQNVVKMEEVVPEVAPTPTSSPEHKGW